MKLAQNLKESAVGQIPIDWDAAKVSDVARITTGSRNTQDKVEDGQFPFFVRSQTIERINSFSFDGEAVLTAGDGVGTGKVFHYINGPFDCHQRVYRISDFTDRMNGFYFFKYFSASFYDRIMSMTAKSSVDSVRREMIADMALPVPPIDEQKRIAAALKDIDDLIASLDALIAKKRDIKQAAMQQLLTGKTRLPGFEGEWIAKRIGSFCTVYSGGTPSTSVKAYYGGSIPWITSSNVNQGKIRSVDAYLTELGLSHSSAKMVSAGTLLLALYGATAGIPAISEIDAAINQAVLAIITEDADAGFLYYLFSLKRDDIVNRLTQGGQPNLSGKLVKSLEILLPKTQDEKNAISQALIDIDFELSEIVEKRAKVDMVRQGMMQQLLTGRIRLV